MRLDSKVSAVAVLDLTIRCDDAAQACHQLMPGVGAFLDRARGARVPILFTGSVGEKGTPHGRVATALKRREEEPVIYPDGYDKFIGGELQPFLQAHAVQNIVIVGSSTHVAVLYTATTAARVYRYNVVIPIDGVNTRNAYEHDYALHQLSVLPHGSGPIRVQFTNLDMIDFEGMT